MLGFTLNDLLAQGMRGAQGGGLLGGYPQQTQGGGLLGVAQPNPVGGLSRFSSGGLAPMNFTQPTAQTYSAPQLMSLAQRVSNAQANPPASTTASASGGSGAAGLGTLAAVAASKLAPAALKAAGITGGAAASLGGGEVGLANAISDAGAMNALPASAWEAAGLGGTGAAAASLGGGEVGLANAISDAGAMNALPASAWAAEGGAAGGSGIGAALAASPAAVLAAPAIFGPMLANLLGFGDGSPYARGTTEDLAYQGREYGFPVNGWTGSRYTSADPARDAWLEQTLQGQKFDDSWRAGVGS